MTNRTREALLLAQEAFLSGLNAYAALCQGHAHMRGGWKPYADSIVKHASALLGRTITHYTDIACKGSSHELVLVMFERALKDHE